MEEIKLDNLFKKLCNQLALTVELETALEIAQREISKLEKDKAELKKRLSDAVNDYPFKD